MEKNKKSIELDYDINSYSYDLPAERIAQRPPKKRDDARLLMLNRRTGVMKDTRFPTIVELAKPNDLVVVNDTKVFPARILGKKETGGSIELFLLEYPSPARPDAARPAMGIDSQAGGADWSQGEVIVLLKSSKRPRPGMSILFGSRLRAHVTEYLADGKARVMLQYQGSLEEVLALYGRTPLPPYIRREPGHDPAADRERYQTLFAMRTGAVAAPTAGLHFSEELLARLQARQVRVAAITLHVGYGTFAPVRTADIRDHRLHEEYVIVSANTARLVNEIAEAGGRIWAVGTTTVRALEYAADLDGRLHETAGWCGLYIYPGYRFKVVDNLITNFHLPGSSLLFLVAALTGREMLMRAYQHAISHKYRFYSYGDAMAIVT